MKIFVSYSSHNRPAVKALVADLTSLSHEPWFDQELSGGQVWWDTILSNLRGCDLFIFALTGHALKSGACKLEYTYAYELGKPILPVLLSDDITISLLPVILQERQFVNYINQDKAALLALNGAIQGIPPAPALPDPLPDGPCIPISPLAALQAEIEQPALSYDEQVGLFHRIKDYVDDPDHHDAALMLMTELEQHPALLAAVFKEINGYLSTMAPGRAPQETPLPEPAAPEVPNVPVNAESDMAAATDTATLVLRRPGEMYAMLRAYLVFMDGHKIGEIRNNSEVTLTVPAGSHTFYLQMDWVKGDPLELDLAAGDMVNLRTTGRMTNFCLGAKLVIELDPDYL